MSAHSMTPAAAIAAISTAYTQRRPKRSRNASRSCSPASRAVMPTTAAPAPNATAAYPSAAFTQATSSVGSRVGGLLRVDLRGLVVGPVLDQDAVGHERRILRRRRPVPLHHDRCAALEQRRRVAVV